MVVIFFLFDDFRYQWININGYSMSYIPTPERTIYFYSYNRLRSIEQAYFANTKYYLATSNNFF